jgi:hypothetical protein
MGKRRLGLGALLVGTLAASGVYLHWRTTEKDRVIAAQKKLIGEIEKKLDRAWASDLVADLRINSVTTAPPQMNVTFFQYAPGTETPTIERTMTLPGDEVYIDALVVTFDRKLVEAGDGLKGKSMLLFRRAFGDLQKPSDGVPLFRRDATSVVPEVAQVDAQPGDFERELWGRFWEYANDPARAAAAGIRVAQGEAPHIKVVQGQVYKLTLRASGGLEIVPRLPTAVTGRPRTP